MEPFMQRTIDTFLATSALGNEVEIIACLDGPMQPEPHPHPQVRSVRLPEPKGMRAAINAGLRIAEGEYVAKMDAHCAFAPGFDKAMLDAMESNDWLMVPRRYSLDDSIWKPVKLNFPRDRHFLKYPEPDHIMSPHHYRVDDSGEELVDTMSFQGSCWLAH